MPAPVANSAPEDIRSAIGRATLIILGVTLIDKVLALLKEMLLAANFGIGPRLDAFNLAYAVPGLIGLLLDGAVISALIPLYADWRRDYSPQGVRDRIMTAGVVCLGASALITGLGIALTPLFFPHLGYGFDAAQTALGIRMETHLMLLVLLEGISAFLAAILRSWKAFAVVTAAQLPINLALILFLCWGEPGNIEILVQGTLVGSLGKTVWLLWAVSRKFPLFSRFHFETQSLKEFLGLVAPLVGSFLIANSNILVDQSMATQLSPGGVSTLRYAYRINDLPLQLIVIAISRAIMPFISEQASAGDIAGMRRIFGQSLSSLGIIAFPVIALIMLYADDVVVVLLRRGAFSAEDARRTATTLRYYTAGLFFFAYAFINSAFFCALKQARVLLIMGLATLVLNFSLNYLFLRLTNDVRGIALSSTVTSALLTLIFISQLSRSMAMERPLRLGIGLLPPAAATLAATVPCLLLHNPLNAAELPTLVHLIAGSALFGIVFLPLQIYLQGKTPEHYQPLWDIHKISRLLRRK